MRPSFTTRIAPIVAVSLILGCASRTREKVEPPPVVWEKLPLGTDADFNDVCFADTLNGWIGGGSYQIEGGLVGRTRDGGRTWRFASGLAKPTKGNLQFSLSAVHFHDLDRGVAVGTGGEIFATDDGGDNWHLARYGRGDHLSDLDFIDDRNGWATTGAGGIVRTHDGGESWVPVMRNVWPRDARPR